MTVSSVTLWAWPTGSTLPDTILRPGQLAAWVGGTGPFDVLHEWDTVNTFDSGALQTDLNVGVTSPNAGVPTADQGPAGTTWYHRATVIDATAKNEVWTITHDHTGGTFDLTYAGSNALAIPWNESNANLKTAIEGLTGLTAVTVTGTTGAWSVEVTDPGLVDLADMTGDGASLTGGTSFVVGKTQDGATGAASSATATMAWFDVRLEERYLYLHANAGAGFTTIDDPADWGVAKGGTIAPDGYANLLPRFLYLHANAGAGFRYSDRPAYGGTETEDWGNGVVGTWADGDETLFNRYLYLMANLNTDLPSPYIFSIEPNFGSPGDAFAIDGYGFRPKKNWAEGGTYTGGPGGTYLTDGHLPDQAGAYPSVAAWADRTTNDDIVIVDTGAPNLINEARVWYRLTDPFTTLTIDWGDSAVGPWTSIGSGSPAVLDPDSTGWATIEAWSTDTDYGSHRYWRFSFVDADSYGELEVNRRMTVGTGDIETRFDDTDTDYLMTISQQSYSRIVAQTPAGSLQPGGDARVENIYPTPDLVSNSKHYTFLPPSPAKGIGVIVKIYDRDAPQQLIAIAGDALGVQFQNLLSGIGSAEFTLPAVSPAWEEPGIGTKYNVVRIELDNVERWWGYVSFSADTVVGSSGREQEATRFVLKGGLSFLSRYTLLPQNWPSIADPVHQFIDKNAGEILTTLIGKAQADGYFVGMVSKFTTLKDSNNENWQDQYTLEFQPGTNLVAVIAQLVGLGIDIRLDSQFQLFLYNRFGFDRTTDPAYVPMMTGHTIKAMSVAEDFESPSNVALISYGDGAYLLHEDVVSTAEWGKFMGFAQSSADNATSAQRLAEVAVAKSGQPLDQIGIAVVRIEDEMEPFQDFDMGDTVRVIDKVKGFDELYRVRAITVDAGDVRNPQFILDLNSIRIEKIIEHEILLQKQNQNTLPVEVASSEPGGTAPREHDHRFPANADLSGKVSAPIVTGLQGVPIDPGPFANNDMWYYDSTADMWLPVTGTKAIGKIPAINADGTVKWTSGGGGGAPAAEVYVNNTETASGTIPAGTNQVPGMILSVAGGRTVLVSAGILTGGHANRYQLYVDGAMWVGEMGMVSTDTSRWFWTIASIPVVLPAGTIDVQVMWQASGSTGSVQMYHRWISILEVTT